MLTLIASDQPRLALHVDTDRSRPWRGLVWAGGVREPLGAHFQARWERGTPLLLSQRPLWQPSPFTALDKEWLVLHAREDFLDHPPAFLEYQRRLTRALLDRLGLSPEHVFTLDEAWDALLRPRRGLAPLWEARAFRASL